MSRSIINNDKKCLVCETTYNLHRHHIFYGTAKRKLSEKYGCWCWLCGQHHNLSNNGIHFNKELDLKVKRLAQEQFEKTYPKLEFIKIFGKNYL